MKKPLLLLAAFLVTIYIVMAFKNPYSVRSLIPNLEPYPDTLYYSSPAWNIVQGKGFVMEAFDFRSKIATPPLYTLYLVPFFALFNDVRSFYFANLLLGIGSLLLFISITYKLFYKDLYDGLIIAILAFFFATNFYIYTLPSLLMAENITLFLSLYMLYLLVLPETKKQSAIAGALGVAVTLVKFSNVPLTAIFYLLYGYKILRKKKLRTTFINSAAISIMIFAAYLMGSHILTGHKNLSANVGFSAMYFPENIEGYIKTLLGQPDRYLWFSHRMLSPIISVIAFFGILIGLATSGLRKQTLLLLAFGLSGLVFMSFFYVRDIRYVLPTFPIMLLLSGYAFAYMKERFGNMSYFFSLIFILGVYLFYPHMSQITGERTIITLKKQVGINFKHAEQPWNYNAIIVFNEYFAGKNQDKKPYIATFLPPYFVSYFANGNYNYLPVSMGQEFFGEKKHPSKTYLTSLTAYYKELLENGEEIYISPYYQSNLRSWEKDYADLTAQFKLELVKSGCFDACNIYRLRPQPKKIAPGARSF